MGERGNEEVGAMRERGYEGEGLRKRGYEGEGL